MRTFIRMLAICVHKSLTITCFLVLAGYSALAVAQNTSDIQYVYDDLGRLHKVRYLKSGKQYTYTYDKAGNRESLIVGGVDTFPLATVQSGSGSEGDNIKLKINLSFPALQDDASVRWTVLSRAEATDYHPRDGGVLATEGEDYQYPQTGVVTFPNGATSVEVSFLAIDDDILESREYFYVRLSEPNLVRLDSDSPVGHAIISNRVKREDPGDPTDPTDPTDPDPDTGGGDSNHAPTALDFSINVVRKDDDAGGDLYHAAIPFMNHVADVDAGDKQSLVFNKMSNTSFDARPVFVSGPGGSMVDGQPDDLNWEFHAPTCGVYKYNYQVKDTSGAVSNVATVTFDVCDTVNDNDPDNTGGDTSGSAPNTPTAQDFRVSVTTKDPEVPSYYISGGTLRAYIDDLDVGDKAKLSLNGQPTKLSNLAGNLYVFPDLRWDFDSQVCGLHKYRYSVKDPAGGVSNDAIMILDVCGTGAPDTGTPDPDPTPLPRVNVWNRTVQEADSGTSNAVVTVWVRDGLQQQGSVSYRTVNGTAIAGQDYVATSGTLTVSPNQNEYTINVEIIGDTQQEGAETFQVVIDNVSGVRKDADTPGTITIAANDARREVVTWSAWSGGSCQYDNSRSSPDGHHYYGVKAETRTSSCVWSDTGASCGSQTESRNTDCGLEEWTFTAWSGYGSCQSDGLKYSSRTRYCTWGNGESCETITERRAQDCRTKSYSTSCGGWSGSCGSTQTRTCTQTCTWSTGGSCGTSSYTESKNESCPAYQIWGSKSCGSWSGSCGSTQTRSCTESCSWSTGGSCGTRSFNESKNEACPRTQNWGSTSWGSWGSCSGGQQTRSGTQYCTWSTGGSCGSRSVSDSKSCPTATKTYRISDSWNSYCHGSIRRGTRYRYCTWSTGGSCGTTTSSIQRSCGANEP